MLNLHKLLATCQIAFEPLERITPYAIFMRNFLQGKDIEVRDVVLKSANDAKFNSFKLSVSVDDADKVMDPILWGRGVRVTRWRKFDN